MSTIETFYYDVLAQQAEKVPDKPAIIMGDTRLTYAMLLKKVDQVAAVLLEKGVQKGDKVALFATASPAWLYTYYGIIRSGGIALILNANMTLKDAAPLVEFADTKYFFYGKSHDVAGSSEDAALLSEKFNIPQENLFSMLDIDLDKAPDLKPDTTGWTVKDDAYIIYTSGTTAFPKAVLTSQYAITNTVYHLNLEVGSAVGDTMVLGVPLFHAYAIYVSWLYLSNGRTICLPDAIKSEAVVKMVEKEPVTDIWSVATVYQGIIDSEELTRIAAPKIRLCVLAGSYTSPVQFLRYESTLNNSIFLNMYGMTETSATYFTTRPTDSTEIRYNTVGRAVSGVEVAAWDEEHGILPPGEVGEIITRGYHVKNGYYKLPPEKQAIDEDGWLHSGDLGVFDEEGNLRIVGRIKDLIIKGGENLAPAEIEAQVMTHPSVATCRIFGYKDRIYGENLGACIVTAPGETFDEDEVRAYMKKKVGSYKSPVYYFTFPEFPLNANGKVDQRKLHIEMLKRLHKMVISGKLAEGIQIISMSIKNSTYNVTPVAAMFQECALCLGFSYGRARKIRHAVEESLLLLVNEMAEDIGDIEISLQYMREFLRINFSVLGLTYDAAHSDERKMAAAIITRLVDDAQMGDKEGKYQVVLDFAYEEDFDIKEFLLKHEPLN